MKSKKTIRINKYIADCGITSRRKAEELILQGVVQVNGQTINDLATQIDPTEDAVSVNGEIIDVQAVDHLYIVLNKPRCYVTTAHDPEGRRTVMELVPISQRVYPVGRLDYLSEGLLLMTNDGDLANMIMHPRFEIVKTYEVKVFGAVSEALLKKIKAGVETEDGLLKPQAVRLIKQLPGKTWLEFRLAEGKNREIRRICEACGITIDKLKRVAIGGLSIQGIQPGTWQYVTKKDLMKSIGINKDGSKSKGEVTFVSRKRSLDVKKIRHAKELAPATDRKFERYGKDSYYATLKLQKESAEKRKIIAEHAKDAGVTPAPSSSAAKKSSYRRK